MHSLALRPPHSIIPLKHQHLLRGAIPLRPRQPGHDIAQLVRVQVRGKRKPGRLHRLRQREVSGQRDVGVVGRAPDVWDLGGVDDWTALVCVTQEWKAAETDKVGAA